MATPSSRGRLIGGQLFGLVISIACIAFVATKVDFAALGQALLRLDPRWIVAGLASLSVGYVARIARWAMMLRAAGSSVTTLQCAAPFLGSIALNNVLPLRAGDVVRALVFPVRLGIERTTAMASLLLERVMDLLSLILCLGLGLAFLGARIELPARLQTLVSILAIASAVVLGALVFASPWIATLFGRIRSRAAPSPAWLLRLAGVAERLSARVGAMSRPRVLTQLAAMSLVVWIFEAGMYYALMRGLDIPTGIAAALTVASTTTLSTLVPSTPGYVGPFHLAAFGAVTMLGSGPSEAGAFAILAHFTLWATTTLAGAIAILTHRNLFSKSSLQNEQDLPQRGARA